MAPRKSRVPALVGSAVALAAVGYLVYSFATKTGSDSDESSRTTSSTPASASKKSPQTHSKITLVVSQELVQSAHVDLPGLLARLPNLVIVVPHTVANKLHRKLKSAIGHGDSYRVIRCDTDVGVIHVIKHIRPELALVASGVGSNIQSEIKRFVGSSELLEEHVEVAEQRLSEL